MNTPNRTFAARSLLACASAWALSTLLVPSAQALTLTDDLVKIGVLTDMAGPYSGMGGPGSVVAARMAIDDCLKAECKGMNIELVSADNQNKADIAASRAREWLDVQKVDALVDLTNSAGALAIQQIIKERGGIAMYSGPATTRLTNDDCARNGFHWMFDTYSLAASPVAAMTQQGAKKWFFVTVDYAFGHSFEKDATAVVKANHGEVVGSVKHPLNASDFSSFLLQAQSSGADAIALANGAQDTVNAMKAVQEFGIGGGKQQILAMLVFLTDVHSMGLETAKGLKFSEGFYWDMDEQTRAFSERFAKLHRGNKPTMVQAGVYSSTLHYLKSVAAAGTDDWKVVAEKMRELPIEDPIMRNASIRDDGRVIHDMYMFEVKTPQESKGPWDYYKLVSTIAAQDAFQPLETSTCPLLKK
ncbi:ABC transporter substrate-binding protein [Lampropedia puyangensis]|uniref:ABC transporter substrate-binding protein n=1 Tax=Lampropedia puyangensis TaxID=1330072 RepID=A0A4S8FGM8_9BURK|nr:ABC transporter substrate-binding protein [Lampropedia puyangensis]THU05032.1 ABC transporter substrate-binding protein [Lampropedia puyangensis]